MSKFKLGDKVVVVENFHRHKFHIGEEVFISRLTNEDYECTNEFGDRWHLTEDEIKLATVVSDWIPCSERMPKNGCFVWVWSCGVAWFAEYRDGIFFQDGDYDSPMVNIAKWHPHFIPTPPQD